MYKIYNNEIKITNFLKGGAIDDDVSDVRMPDLVTDNNYKDQIWTNSSRSELRTDGGTKNLASEVIPTQYLTKRFPINLKDLSESMVKHVLNEIEGLNTALNNKIFTELTSENWRVDRPVSQEQKNLEQNVLAYGVNFAHDIGLIDSEGDILDYGKYKQLLEDVKPTDTSSSKALKYLLVENEKGTIVETDRDGLRTSRSDKFQSIIKKLQKLKKEYPSVVGECMKGFPKITLKTYKYMYNLQGGVYDNLNYILNGGAVTAIVRTPNVSDYFENQLRFHERRLKNNNKALSNNSKNSIQQIIDRLRQYEKELKVTFENLKNAVNIDENVVDVNLHKDKLKNARKQIKKQITYHNVLRAILDTLDKTDSNSTLF